MLHIPPTNSLLNAKQEPYKKAYLLTKNIEEFSGKKVQKNGPVGRKRLNKKSKRTRQKNNRGDSKVESNDSPEIPDRGETSDIPGLPSEAYLQHVLTRHKRVNIASNITPNDKKPTYSTVS